MFCSLEEGGQDPPPPPPPPKKKGMGVRVVGRGGAVSRRNMKNFHNTTWHFASKKLYRRVSQPKGSGTKFKGYGKRGCPSPSPHKGHRVTTVVRVPNSTQCILGLNLRPSIIRGLHLFLVLALLLGFFSRFSSFLPCKLYIKTNLQPRIQG